jgi:bifunctional non-homologous end joining protein LigD
MFNVMLADSAPCNTDTITRFSNGEWVFDLKMDGLRAVLVCNKGQVKIWNRSGNDITMQWPEIVAAAQEAWPTSQVILDGELIVNDSDGRPNFKLTATRGKQTKTAIIKARAEANPGYFHAFDVLYYEGLDVRTHKYRDRKDLVAIVTSTAPEGSHIVHRVPWTDGHEAMRWVLENKAEGLIIKRLNSTYQAGRRSDWIKVKPTETVSCVVIGYEAGEGARASSFGALKLAFINDQKFVPCGKVGTGFKDADLREIVPLLERFGPDRRATSLDDMFVIEVEFQEFTEDGALRFPVYRGRRLDQTIHDCTLDQVQPKAILEATQ